MEKILVVPEQSTIANDALWAAIRARPLIVDGVEVYPSKSATYLGTKLTDTLDLAEMARARGGKGWAAFKRCERLLADSTVPLATKMLIVKGYVLPPAVYASELWEAATPSGASHCRTCWTLPSAQSLAVHARSLETPSRPWMGATG